MTFIRAESTFIILRGLDSSANLYGEKQFQYDTSNIYSIWVGTKVLLRSFKKIYLIASCITGTNHLPQ